MSAPFPASNNGPNGQDPDDEKVTVPLNYGDDLWSRFKNYTNLSFDRLNREDVERFYQLEEFRRWATMHENCMKQRSELMRKSPIVRFMREKIGQIGGKITRDSFPCDYCTEWKGGGFSPIHGMQLCANKLYNKNHQEDVMAHEMIHVYDTLRFEVDWNNMRHAACSEIRASSLSGECRFTREFWKNSQYKINKGYQDCVRRKAILSMVARPQIRDEDHAAKVINEVFDSCLTDTRPFDEVYR